ncbi:MULTISPECIES: serine/threonine protein kinase [Pirellulaceae]|nr:MULTISPECIES: serine/threonine-protein kinase [Pirellulaceae]
MTAKQLEDAMKTLREGSLKHEFSDEELSDYLINCKMLTQYQADQLSKGLTKLTLGPYVITDWIGQGGMGQVFKAEHNFMGREVAIKVLPQQRSTPESIGRFLREIRMQAQLDHANLVRAYDAGQDGNVHFLVTEYVPGTDLRRLVRAKGHLNQHQGASIISQAARGLAYAHDKKLIHRDVKPGNILVTRDGTSKVSDLGLADFMNDNSEESKLGKIVGTIDYLAPEQIRDPHDVSAKWDIYSLGCTFYYALTGKVPFPGGNVKDKARRHCEEPPLHPHRFNPSIDRELVEIIAEMMEKDPLRRIASASEVVARLEPWASDHRASDFTGQPIKSAWQPPPPVYTGAESARLNDTEAGSNVYELSESGSGSSAEQGSQYSQSTVQALMADQDTKTIRDSRKSGAIPPPIPVITRYTRREKQLIMALVFGLPASAVFGAIVAYVATVISQ